MKPRSYVVAALASSIAMVVAVLVTTFLAPVPTQAAPNAQAEATAVVHANQTATAVAVATEAAQPVPSLPTPTPVTSGGHLVTPEKRPLTDDLLRSIKVPQGFWVDVFARDLGNTRMLAIAPDGTVYVTRREQGDALMLRDTNGDGKADVTKTIASGLPYLNGITIHAGMLYLATDHDVLRGKIAADGTVSGLTTIIDDLPDAGQHPNRMLRFGPDGMLYISVGSTCNACNDTNPENAAILRANPDGSNRTIFAKGLRNTIGFDWNPSSGQLWGMDQGADWRGDDQPPEELNLLVPGGVYGWPFCFANQQPDAYFNNDPPGTTKEAYCGTTRGSILNYQAHSASMQMEFYTGTQFPQDYNGDAFVAMRGSWNRFPATGYKVVRVHFENGWPANITDFMSGFLIEDGAAQFARLSGIAVAPYGSLFVADDSNGVIYRVSYTGAK